MFGEKCKVIEKWKTFHFEEGFCKLLVDFTQMEHELITHVQF